MYSFAEPSFQIDASIIKYMLNNIFESRVYENTVRILQVQYSIRSFSILSKVTISVISYSLRVGCLCSPFANCDDLNLIKRQL